MSILNRIISYWYDCIKNEDILEQDISLQVRSKAVLYPFDEDQFIFERKENSVPVTGNEKLNKFSQYINTKGYDAYYGYPILFYFNEKTKIYSLAPLFVIKVNFINNDQKLYLQKDEQYPTCGIQAFSTIGFRTEEIASISQSIEELFKSEITNSLNLADKCLGVINNESEMQINEPIYPDVLTNSNRISKNMTPGIYNKSLIFAGENSNYNLSLLRDLLELKSKKDLDKTALSIILEEKTSGNKINKTPILPFPSNEYQVKALKDVFQNKLTVITGPPGTGKSQYISNLLINLFHEGKTVLFVSHTNEAVNVVNKKINEQFRNLMLRTGNKEFRQNLSKKFNELILDSEKMTHCSIVFQDIKSLWKTIISYRQTLLEIDILE
ncbi:AAA domain-containing protein, partial [Spirochaetota bacterium]